MAKSEVKTGDLQAAWYIVAFIDILGQREALKNLRDIPSGKDSEEYHAFISQMRETLGLVRAVSETLKTYFISLGQESGLIQHLSAAKQKEARRLRKHELHLQHYGDGLVAWASLGGGFEAFPTGRVWALLTACASLMLLFLGIRNRPLRGGIDIGIGAELYPGEMYGAGIARAYELESEVAEFPRVVVGTEFMSFLRWAIDSPLDGEYRQLNREMAESCLELLAPDIDGQLVLDYMGPKFRVLAGDTLGVDAGLKAYDFVKAECDRWHDAGNVKLSKRYHLLKAYMEARIHHWQHRRD